MAKKKSLKTALVMTILSLVACIAMFAGTTFAWFTDSVTSSGNIIASGTLDVEMYWAKGTENPDSAVWADASQEAIFDYANWEPGYLDAKHVKISNKGTLAFKYGVRITATDEVSKLADVIDVYFMDPAAQVTSRTVLGNKVGTLSDILGEDPIANGTLLAQKDAVVTIVLKMREDAGNEYQDLSIGSEFSVQVLASQVMSESDSFGTDYDKGAPWVGGSNIDWYLEDPDATSYTLTSGAELAGLAEIVNGTAVAPVVTYAATSNTVVADDFKGKTIYLGSDIDLQGFKWTPIGTNANPFRANFDGQGHTIYNLVVDNDGWAGLIGHAGLSHAVTIKNVNIDGAVIHSNRMAGALVGQLYGNIENCKVNDVTITVVPNWDEEKSAYDNGDKVGGIVGWIGDNNNNRVISECSATDVSIKAYRDMGGIAGYVAYSTTIKNSSVKKINIDVDQKTNSYGEKAINAGAIWGRNSVSSTNVGVIDQNNTFEEVTISYEKSGIEYKADGNDVLLYLVSADYEGTSVNVAEGVTAIGGYAFAFNSDIEEIVLSSTVKTLNDRAFRDTSASTVVLNEGLENISYQAFRNALNVESVVIPSTVKTISKEAFQNSGIKTLTVPATVETIEYGAMRDMKQVESVVIESNADIPVYAFRACTNLRTVILTGDDVTFGGGSKGMIFTNKESGDGTAITVYVANETVKNRLLAADTAATDYGGYTIVVMSEVVENNNITGALTDGADTVFVPAGNYTFPSSEIGEGDVIVCDKDTVFEGTSSLNINGATVQGATFSNPTGTAGTSTINGTYKDCVFKGSNGLRWCYAGDTVVFENCVFDGSTYGAHFDGGANEVVFKNCTFSGFNAFGGAVTLLTMEGCTFKANGRSNYNGVNLWGSTNLKNCTFIFDGTADYEWIDACGDNKTLTITDCVVTDGVNEIDIKTVVGNYGSGNTIIVDEEYLAWSASEFNSAVTAGATTVYLLGDAEVDLNGNQRDGLKIIGLSENVKVANTTKYAGGNAVGAIWQAIYLENVTVTNTVYTMADGGKATFKYVNFAAGVRNAYGADVKFIDCTFGSNSEGYAMHFQSDAASEGGVISLEGCKFNGGKVHLGSKRSYDFKGCDFATGTDFQVWSNISLEGCTVNGVEVTSENIATLFPNLNLDKVTLK